MPLEIKTVLEAAGLPADIEDEVALVAAINKRYVVRDEAIKDSDLDVKFYGKFAPVHERAIQKAFGLNPNDLVGKTLKEVIAFASEKTAERIKELETDAGKGNDEKFKNLETEHGKLKAKYEDLNGVNQKLIQEKDQLTADFDGKIKSFKLDEAYKSAKGKLLFAEGIPEAAKVGYDTIFKSKHKINFDEKGNTIVTDLEDKPIPNPKKTGVYLSLDEVMDLELDSQGLKKKNNLGTGQAKQTVQVTDTGKQVRQVNPAALAHADKLAAGV